MTDVGLQLSEDREQIMEIIYFQSTLHHQPSTLNLLSITSTFQLSGLPAFQPSVLPPNVLAFVPIP
jgi:hypothetical protein